MLPSFSHSAGDGSFGKSREGCDLETQLTLTRIVAIVVGFFGCLLFLFVPESFWDRTPVPKSRRGSKHPGSKHGSRLTLNLFHPFGSHKDVHHTAGSERPVSPNNAILEKEAAVEPPERIATPKKVVIANDTYPHRDLHVEFASEEKTKASTDGGDDSLAPSIMGLTPVDTALPPASIRGKNPCFLHIMRHVVTW